MKRTKPAKRILAILEAAGCKPEALTDDEIATWQRRWREIYAKELHAATGRWVHDDFDWHVFSWAHHAAKTGDEAWNEYRRREPCRFVVLGAYARDPFGFRCDGKPPERLKSHLEILVAPTSLAWTMAFTHEEPVLGPYFALP